MANVKISADSTGLPAAADLEALFTSCVRKTFSTQDVKAIQQTCSRLATLCQVSSAAYDPNRKVFVDFRERYALANPDVAILSKKDKKKAKKHNKNAKKSKKEAKKKAKKQAKKDKKKAKKAAKKGKSKKELKKEKKDKKDKKKKDKKEQKKAKEEKKKEKKKAKEEKKKAKKEQKKAEKAKKKAEKTQNKEAENAVSKEERKKAKKEKKEAEKAAKKAKKEQKKLAKKGKKGDKKFKSAEAKLVEQERKLAHQEAKIAAKIRNFVLKAEKKHANLPRIKLSPSKIEKRLTDIRAALNARDTSVSRFAPCLIFTPDTGDSQCAVLKRASEFTLQAEECWAGYLSTLQHCKENASKKKAKACYSTYDVASARCGSLATQARVELQKLVAGSSAQV